MKYTEEHIEGFKKAMKNVHQSLYGLVITADVEDFDKVYVWFKTVRDKVTESLDRELAHLQKEDRTNVFPEIYEQLHRELCEFPALCDICSKDMSPERKISELKKYLK